MPPAPGTDFPAKAVPLREDVGVLGALLGDVIKAQGGEELFNRVEKARLAARDRRSGDSEAAAELLSTLGDLTPNDAQEVVRAFSAYFGLVNLAEKIHRIRRGRTYLADESGPQPGGLHAVIAELAEGGCSADELLAIIRSMRVVPVFTAHPTESHRRTLLLKDQRIARALVDRIDPAKLLPRENQAALARIKEEVATAWQTEEFLRIRPEVADEVEQTAFYLSDAIYRVLPALYDQIHTAFQKTYGSDITEKINKPVLTFASWVGGDMDGNPKVGADTISATLFRHRELILRRYRAELEDLFGRFSHSLSRVDIATDLRNRISNYETEMPAILDTISPRYRDMPYRVFLSYVAARVDATRADAEHAYSSPEELLSDLHCIEESLSEHRGEHAGQHRILRLIRRVQTFGFHLATLDVRQDALMHRTVVGHLLGAEGFLEMDREQRTALLEAALADPAHTPSNIEQPEVVQALAVIHAIKDGLQRFGKRAVGPYIISMAQGPDDALALLYLAKVGGLEDENGCTPLDVAPLFETVNDLQHGPATMAALFDNPVYRDHLKARGDHQVIMLGYSDSNKDSGFVASRWALYQAQIGLSETCRDAKIGNTLFHGRGGTVSRGGGKTRDAVLASPPGTVGGSLRVTEQGEIIHAKYGLRGIALRTMELMLGAVLEVEARDDTEEAPDPRWIEVMDRMAVASRQSYRSLVYDDPAFVQYFREATPIDVIERLLIGSRPASRRSGAGVENLRAIPWVFAWTQCRHILPGWYGLHAGLEAVRAQFGTDILKEMAAKWRPFSNLLADVEMVLAKADMPIAGQYAKLCADVGDQYYSVIHTAFDETCEHLCAIQGTTTLLENEPVLYRAIQLRNPYVDPMSLLQVDLLKRWRAGGSTDEELLHALFTTVKGIAGGLQNTG
ncbi:MAG: phosphoenolpyruvate carboxylase [Myxococcales bacterium]|nr:phosphoenolpyruvate carboxylase [Myxococcales bacterium]